MNSTSRIWRLPVGQTWRSGRARLDLSVEEAAAKLKIAAGSLRNIESEQPRATVSERLAHRAGRLYEVPVADLLRSSAGSEGRPDEPPQQPKSPKAPPRRQTKKAPRRARDAA